MTWYSYDISKQLNELSLIFIFFSSRIQQRGKGGQEDKLIHIKYLPIFRQYVGY